MGEDSAGRVHYVDEGQGRPLVLLHGNPTWSFLYRDLIQALRGDFRCVALDYPGFGLSDRPVIYGYTPAEHAAVVGEVVEQLDLHGMIVMGHDWGGPIGLSVAAARAERVSGLVLGNTWFWPSELRARMFSAVMSSRPMQRAMVERNFFVDRLIPSGVVRTLSDDEMEHYRGVQARPEDRRGVAELPRQIVTPLRGWPGSKAPFTPVWATSRCWSPGPCATSPFRPSAHFLACAPPSGT